MKEVIKPLKGLIENGDNYEVSNLGYVRHAKTLRKLKPYINRWGYCQLSFSLNSKTKKHLLHRVVAIAFLDNPYNRPEVNHKDGVKTNNEVGNLEWATSSENQKHALIMGLRKDGKRSLRTTYKEELTEKITKTTKEIYRKVLTAEDVAKIKELAATGLYSQRVLGETFGVSKNSIANIIHGRTWKEIS